MHLIKRDDFEPNQPAYNRSPSEQAPLTSSLSCPCVPMPTAAPALPNCLRAADFADKPRKRAASVACSSNLAPVSKPQAITTAGKDLQNNIAPSSQLSTLLQVSLARVAAASLAPGRGPDGPHLRQAALKFEALDAAASQGDLAARARVEAVVQTC